MLTVDRPGLFKGRFYNTSYWVVIDPAVSDPIAAQNEWVRARVLTNRSPYHVIESICAWALGLGLVATGVWLGFRVVDSVGWIVSAAILFGSLVAAVVVPAAVRGMFRPVAPPAPPSPEFETLSSHLSKWATDTTDLSVIWELQKHISDLSELRYLHSESERTEPFIRAEYQRALQDFLPVALSAGFPVPGKLRSLTVPPPAD